MSDTSQPLVSSSENNNNDTKDSCGCGCLLALCFLAFCIWLLFFYKQSVEIRNTGFYAQNDLIETSSASDSDVAPSVNQGLLLKNTTDHTVIVCLGKDGDCTLHTNGAHALRSPGLTLKPHQTSEVIFNNSGVYTITLRASDGTKFAVTNFTVTVMENDDGSNV